MSCSVITRTRSLLRNNENECLANGQRGQVSCSRTLKTSVLLRDNANECLAQGK